MYDVKINTDYDRFTISEGIVSVNGDEIENLDLSIPTESLKVQIVNNGVPVKGSILSSMIMTHGMQVQMRMVN